MTPPRVLFLSKFPNGGSFIVRGKEVASQRPYWEALSPPPDGSIGPLLEWCDLVCIIKRIRAIGAYGTIDQGFPVNHLDEVHKAGKPIVFDVVDWWGQGSGKNHGAIVHNAQDARELFSIVCDTTVPEACIFANQKMHDDLSLVSPLSTFIYHHHKPIDVVPLRKEVRTVGYEGQVRYLGEWEQRLRFVCGCLGLEFIVNPIDFTDMDIGVSVRGGNASNYLSNNYKSNIKITNIMAAGIPVIAGDSETSAHEVDNGTIGFFSTEDELQAAIERLLDYDERCRIRKANLETAESFSLSRIADRYDGFFQRVVQ